MNWNPQDMDVTDVELPESTELDQYSYDHLTVDEFDEEPINVVTACIIPALVDTATELILPVFASAIITQVLVTLIQYKFALRQEIYNLICLFVGVALLAFHFRLQLELFTLTVIAYALASILCINFKLSPWYICGLIILANEVFSFQKINLMRIRMHLMLLLMKMVSFDDEVTVKQKKDKSTKNIANTYSVLELLCYLFHPSSILLNSWHARSKTLVDMTGYSMKLLSVLYSLTISLVFLLFSSCLIHVFIEDHVNRYIANALYSNVPFNAAEILYKLLSAHCIALQFRCSHYFICYLTEATFKLWNMDQPKLCSASQVELPRSLVQVVVAWNIPMHQWLKKFVFSKLKTSYSDFTTIITTYFISSFMHGLNFQIWSVLLSLGILTYLEDQIRYKLSNIFSCCIMSRPCKSSREGNVCSRGHKNQKGLIVFVTNLLFSLLAIIHLAFLGSTFDGSETSALAINVIKVWSHLGFYSHIIALITFVIYILL